MGCGGPASEPPPAPGPHAAPSAHRAPSDGDAELEARARALLDRAREVEPTVTQLLVRLAQEAGGDMVGLEHRLKTLESTVRKMRLFLAEDPSLTVETIAVQDALRYTMRVDDRPAGNYVRVVAATLDALEAGGHRVLVVKNYWPTDDNYAGVNAVLEAPSGLPWELQFHTPASYEAQHVTRAWYEELRLSSTPDHRKRELFDLMTATWNDVPIPAGVLAPEALHEAESILTRPRP